MIPPDVIESQMNQVGFRLSPFAGTSSRCIRSDTLNM